MKIYVVYDTVEDTYYDNTDTVIIGASSTKDGALRMIKDIVNVRRVTLESKYVTIEFKNNGWRAYVSGEGVTYYIRAVEFEDGVISDGLLVNE